MEKYYYKHRVQLEILICKINFKSSCIFIWLLFFNFNLSFSQENIVSNGDFSGNRLFIPENEKLGIPYLDNFHPVYIDNFKGEFYYPYPDSSVYIGLRFGFGFLRYSGNNYWRTSLNKSSDIYGTFKKQLNQNSIYKLSFDLNAYWGNILIRDLLFYDLIDNKGNIIATHSFKLEVDSFFKTRTLTSNFKSNGDEKFFHIYFDSLKEYNYAKTKYTVDSINKNRRELDIKIAETSVDKNFRKFLIKEDSFRRNTPFVYYLTNNYNCIEIVKNEKKCIDTIKTINKNFDELNFENQFDSFEFDFEKLTNKNILNFDFVIYSINQISSVEKQDLTSSFLNQIKKIIPIDIQTKNIKLNIKTFTKSKRSNISNQLNLLILENTCIDDYTDSRH